VWGDGGAYATWTTYVARWGADLGVGDERLPVLGAEDFAPQTWVRLTNHILDAINARLRLCTTALTNDMASARTELGVGQALVRARTGLASVLRLASSPSLPEDLRGQLRGLVEQQIVSVQQSLQQDGDSLERSGWRRVDADARRRTIKENPLTGVLTSAMAAPQPAPGTAVTPPAWAPDPGRRPQRQLFVD
jgi:hypothetical protein